MKPKILKSKRDHTLALAQVEKLMDAVPGSADEAELELWSLLVENYETEHYPVPPPDPVEAIRFRMDQRGLKQKDLVPYFKNKSKISEVLNRKRQLSLSMIRALHTGLDIPAEILVREPQASDGKALRKRARSKA
jgi:HTH-type transcriptional regulator / antitoxin HigA